MRETYSERWSSRAGKPTGEISRDEAQRRHESGEPYVVTLGEPGDPDNLYERLARDVERTSGGTVRAWVYVAAPRVTARLRAHGTRIDSGDWVDGR